MYTLFNVLHSANTKLLAKHSISLYISVIVVIARFSCHGLFFFGSATVVHMKCAVDCTTEA